MPVCVTVDGSRRWRCWSASAFRKEKNMKSRGFPLHKLFARMTVPGSTRPKDQAARRRRRILLSVEELESRLVPSTYTVLTKGNATGAVTPVSPGVFTAPTLRAAIDAADRAG